MLLNSPLEIELTTKCTLGCPACPRNDPKDLKEHWDVGHLDKEIVKSFANTSTDRTYLFVGCYGDPIYHPDFIEIMDYYTSNNKKFVVHTNGSSKTQKWWDKLTSTVKWGGQQFVFSVDGLEDTNHLYRRNAKWNTVIRGMQAMGSLPANNKPFLEWKFLVFPYNKHQIKKAEELAMDIGFDKFTPVKSERDWTSYVCDNPEIYRWPDDKA